MVLTVVTSVITVRPCSDDSGDDYHSYHKK